MTRLANRNNIKPVFFIVSAMMVIFSRLPAAINTIQGICLRKFAVTNGVINFVHGLSPVWILCKVSMNCSANSARVIYPIVSCGFSSNFWMAFCVSFRAFYLTTLALRLEAVAGSRVFIKLRSLFSCFTFATRFHFILQTKCPLLRGSSTKQRAGNILARLRLLDPSRIYVLNYTTAGAYA